MRALEQKQDRARHTPSGKAPAQGRRDPDGGRALRWIYRVPEAVPLTGGRPLDAATRDYFEPRVGFALGGVRLHDDEATQRAAAAMDARAFTVGEHIGFGEGAHSTGSAEGRQVLAHELAHVGQAYEGRATGAGRISHPGEPLEREAERAAATVARPAWRALAPLPPPSLGSGSPVLRMGITMRSGNQVTDTAPAATDNIREEVLSLLDRLHTMWSITNDAYDNQAGYVRRLAAGAQVPQRDPSPPAAVLAAGITAPWSFQPTIDAIDRNRGPHLAAAVIRRYMGVSVSDSVGNTQPNVREDVLAVMGRLNFLMPYGSFASEKSAVTALAAGSRVPASSLTGTLASMSAVKVGLASGTLGLVPMHGDEREYGGADRYAAQTAVVDGGTVMVTHAGASASTPFTKHFSVFVPRGAVPGRNKVHLFFTPFFEPSEFVAQQGLRAQYDGTEWILIGVPALVEGDSPNFITISTAEITRCLAAAGRGTSIDAIRMSAHSRGHRGLSRTIGMGSAPPLIDLGKVEGVTVFDASYSTLGGTLTSHRGALTRMQDPAHPGRFAPGAVRLYDVTVGNVSGLPGISLNQNLIRGLAYVRLVQEGLARGEIGRGDLSALPAATQSATSRLLSAIPARGAFSTRTPTPAGFTDLARFLSTNRADLTVVDDPTNGLKPFISSTNLDWGMGFSRSIDAHHWFVTELAHEAVD